MKLFDTPQMKQRTLDALVRERVMLVASNKLNLGASDERIARLFQDDPQFAVLRKPDGTINKDLIQAQGMSVAQFEQRLRQDIGVRQVMLGVAGTPFVPEASVGTALDALLQRREVRVARFDPAKLRGPGPAHRRRAQGLLRGPRQRQAFAAAEQASIEYVVLDLESLKSGITSATKSCASTTAERGALHGARGAPRQPHPDHGRQGHAGRRARQGQGQGREPARRSCARSRRASPNWPRSNSNDPGSAQQGRRPRLVRPRRDGQALRGRGVRVEAAARSRGVVETDFGYHIIQLDRRARRREETLRGGAAPRSRTRSRKQLAQRKYAEGRRAVQQPGLRAVRQPAAGGRQAQARRSAPPTACAALRRPTRRARWPTPSSSRPCSATRRCSNKRNTEAIEIGAEPARRRPRDAVRPARTAAARPR